MADGPLGSRAASTWPITKLFTAFRIALDLKKLALAGAGIFATWLGWWALCWLFYTPDMPQWKDYERAEGNEKASWKKFEFARARWNLLYRLAGPPTNDPKEAIRIDAGDIASSQEEFKLFEAVIEGRQPLTIDVAKKQLVFEGAALATFKANEADLDVLKAIAVVPLVDVVLNAGDEKSENVTIAGKTLTIETGFDKLRSRRDAVKPLWALPRVSQDTFLTYLVNPAIKSAGKFRISPWMEDRGPNPYLLAVGIVNGDNAPFGRGGFFGWLLHDQLPVLVEPIVKFISPVFFIFQRDAGGWRNFFFLVFIILWNLAVWGYFGGAICRLAAVQFARNEKIPLTEAIGFVHQRCKHFFLAPVFPLACLCVLMLVLGLFGFITGWTHFVGDIVVAGLLWPVVVVVGLIMAVLLVGLIAWPLMYPTIAVEGSDSFDALSRSYSYLYQSPWSFLGYVGTALIYGAALVFFVGFMGSLTVSIGQWGFSGVPGLASDDATKDRTPAYFFAHAPTSFGWRDLFLHDSIWAQPVEAPPVGVGMAKVHFELKKDYVDAISWNNSIGGWLVTFWLGVVFLLVVGFGYSYFWTASTIIYFLMRKKVDDTECDEIYLDEDESPPPPPPPMKEPAPAAKPGTMSLNVVEPPPTAPPASPPPASPPAS